MNLLLWRTHLHGRRMDLPSGQMNPLPWRMDLHRRQMHLQGRRMDLPTPGSGDLSQPIQSKARKGKGLG